MDLGLGQKGRTCWFYSALNLLLLSDAGLKLLWAKLQKVYTDLGPVQKRYFNANINAHAHFGVCKRRVQFTFGSFSISTCVL